jgi:hypothetical protein
MKMLKKINFKSCVLILGVFFILVIAKTASSQEVVFGIKTPVFKIFVGNTQYDQYGYDRYGYNRYGYDRNGYDGDRSDCNYYDRDRYERDRQDREDYYKRDRDDHRYENKKDNYEKGLHKRH